MATSEHPGSPGAAKSKELRRVVLSSYIGSTVEYYDFILYAVAASLVFGDLFFGNLTPVAGTIASLGTLAVGYVSRPLGAVIFGHFGDKVGRKSVLVSTMLLMGVSTALIGALPTSDQVGMLAPILLIVLRLAQGIAVGGEWGGAALMAFEHAPPNRRGLASSFVNAGAGTGNALASGVLALLALLPDDQFFTWGWRIPFLLSAVLVFLGLWVRLKVSESPLFVEEKRRQEALGTDQTPVSPLRDLIRAPKTLLIVFFGLLGPFLINGALATAFGLSYAKSSGLDLSSVLGIQLVACLVSIVGSVVSGAVSDVVGRKPVMLFGLIAGVVLAYPFLLLLSTGGTVQVLIAFVGMYALSLAPMFGPCAAFLSEQFHTGSRYTGSSLGYQAASTVGGGFGPMILASLLAWQSGGYGLILAFVTVLGAFSAVMLSRTRVSPPADDPAAVTEDGAHQTSVSPNAV